MLGSGRGEERKGCEESAPLTLSSECLSHIGQAEAICCAVPAPWMSRRLHFAYVSAALLFSLVPLAKPFLKPCRNRYPYIAQATAFLFFFSFSPFFFNSFSFLSFFACCRSSSSFKHPGHLFGCRGLFLTSVQVRAKPPRARVPPPGCGWGLAVWSRERSQATRGHVLF